MVRPAPTAPRRAPRPGPWLASSLILLIELPNLVWSIRNDWPEMRMAGVLSERSGGPLGSFAQVPLLLILLAGPPLVVLGVPGVRQLWTRRDQRWRLTAAAVALVVFTLSGGKPYYTPPAAALVALFAAGAVRVEEGGRHRAAWTAAIATPGAFAVVIGLPVLPPVGANAIGVINPTSLETYGWPSFVRQVKTAVDTLPPGTAIYTSNYGEADALTILGPVAGLANPVVTAQNTYGTWGPPAGTPSTVLCGGEFTADTLRRTWSDVREIAVVTMPNDIRNEEIRNHAALYVCRDPHGTWAQLWPTLKHFD